MPSNIVQTRFGADMDIRHYKLSPEKLREQIIEDVKASQIFVGRHLPDKLIMTKDQFEILENDMERMQETEWRFYKTKYNVMEVHVDQ